MLIQDNLLALYLAPRPYNHLSTEVPKLDYKTELGTKEERNYRYFFGKSALLRLYM